MNIFTLIQKATTAHEKGQGTQTTQTTHTVSADTFLAFTHRLEKNQLTPEERSALEMGVLDLSGLRIKEERTNREGKKSVISRSISDNEARELAKAIRANKSLCEINLKGTKLSSNVLTIIANGLPNSNVTKFEVEEPINLTTIRQNQEASEQNLRKIKAEIQKLLEDHPDLERVNENYEKAKDISNKGLYLSRLQEVFQKLIDDQLKKLLPANNPANVQSNTIITDRVRALQLAKDHLLPLYQLHNNNNLRELTLSVESNKQLLEILEKENTILKQKIGQSIMENIKRNQQREDRFKQSVQDYQERKAGSKADARSEILRKKREEQNKKLSKSMENYELRKKDIKRKMDLPSRLEAYKKAESEREIQRNRLQESEKKSKERSEMREMGTRPKEYAESDEKWKLRAELQTQYDLLIKELNSYLRSKEQEVDILQKKDKKQFEKGTAITPYGIDLNKKCELARNAIQDLRKNERQYLNNPQSLAKLIRNFEIQDYRITTDATKHTKWGIFHQFTRGDWYGIDVVGPKWDPNWKDKRLFKKGWGVYWSDDPIAGSMRKGKLGKIFDKYTKIFSNPDKFYKEQKKLHDRETKKKPKPKTP